MTATTSTTPPTQPLSTRLVSLDTMRGLIMILLAAESCRLYESLHHLAAPGFAAGMVEQFFHHPWHGLRAWDLVQPAFMTMAGTALYISYYYKRQRGIAWQQQSTHILLRCAKLFVLGTALHCVYAGKLVWELWNVLTQLAFTTLIAWVIINGSYTFQLIISLLLLLLTEFLYRRVLMPGFDQPFTEHKNFGAWFDTLVMGKINTDGWVAINIIPTAAHTIWGVLAGKLLVQEAPAARKIKALLWAGGAGLIIGYGLDISNITPIIKRISTTAFIFVSGGWVLLILAFLYWLVDVRQVKRYAWIFTVVGMNAIFIYLFFETVGHQWLNGTIAVFVQGGAGLIGVTPAWQEVLSASATLYVEWYICYWLYKKKIFFKL
ncbi:DUF5009 domain-containing protein [Pseudoflavitalea sp. X16]|uniref:acyltransferase family protein n=1 Tax=Paraflavitalea devenefica TaxID=2716334 RepID=UPI00141EE96E|nr:DUF5009 domain-containing protein [Paraflavitalea devenefica]NII26996.1 DUF5009 domain-containing protein [Paraflavitalea devenefica]